ncbi:MAG: hypothetical protein OXE57_01110 [Alphaproteobacteria bacterium]|nr:hypothetical protein [Alphaproteobacteria bacterium]
MPTLDFDATMVPQDLVAVAGLTQGVSYSGQNISTTATLFSREAINAPTPGARAWRVEAGGAFTLKPMGAPIWLWTDDERGCPVVLAETP